MTMDEIHQSFETSSFTSLWAKMCVCVGGGEAGLKYWAICLDIAGKMVGLLH